MPAPVAMFAKSNASLRAAKPALPQSLLPSQSLCESLFFCEARTVNTMLTIPATTPTPATMRPVMRCVRPPLATLGAVSVMASCCVGGGSGVGAAASGRGVSAGISTLNGLDRCWVSEMEASKGS
jgi:hypothetical protein